MTGHRLTFGEYGLLKKILRCVERIHYTEIAADPKKTADALLDLLPGSTKKMSEQADEVRRLREKIERLAGE